MLNSFNTNYYFSLLNARYVKLCFIRYIILLICWFIFAFIYYQDASKSIYYKYKFNPAPLKESFYDQLNEANTYFDQLLNKYKNNGNNNNSNYDNYEYYNTRESNEFYSSVCVAILTTNRDVPTLHQTLSSLILSMNKQQKSSITINIVNTAYHSVNHTVINKLNDVNIPYIHIINYNDLDNNILPNMLANFDYLSPGKLYMFREPDPNIYRHSLAHIHIFTDQICDKPQYKYTLVLEDDLLFTVNFFDKLKYLIDNINNYHANNYNKYKQFAWLKLFVSDSFYGFATGDIPLLLLLSITIAGLIMLLFHMVDKKYFIRITNISDKSGDFNYTRKITWVYYLFQLSMMILYTTTVVLILLSIEKQHLQFLFGPKLINTVIPHNPEINVGLTVAESATPGILGTLYPQTSLKAIRTYIIEDLMYSISTNKNPETVEVKYLIAPIDVILMKYFNGNKDNVIQYRSIPDLVQHMGFVSTAKHKTNKIQGNINTMFRSCFFEKPANQFNNFDVINA